MRAVLRAERSQSPPLLLDQVALRLLLRDAGTDGADDVAQTLFAALAADDAYVRTRASHRPRDRRVGATRRRR